MQDTAILRIHTVEWTYSPLDGSRGRFSDEEARFDTYPTSNPIETDDGAPGFASHSAEYSHFFGFPPDYDRYGSGPSVVNTTSHLALL